MSNIANAEGTYPHQWAADLLATNRDGQPTFIGRISSTRLPKSGMQRIRVRDTRTNRTGTIVRDTVGDTLSMDQLHNLATDTARTIIEGGE